MNSIVADKRGGAFADDLYVVLVDNRNGTIRDSNNDAFFYKSTDGGTTWIGPTRVNDDRVDDADEPRLRAQPEQHRAETSANCPERNSGRGPVLPVGHDRRPGQPERLVPRPAARHRLAGRSGAWPTSKTEVGNYLVWYWGAQCRITPTATVSQTTTGPVPAGATQCVAPEAVVNPTVATGFDPGAGPVPGNGQNSATLPFKQLPDLGRGHRTSTTRSERGSSRATTAATRAGPIVRRRRERRSGLRVLDRRPERARLRHPTTTQPGRNPICEQSDVFFDRYSLDGHGNDNGGNGHADSSFLVAPCPSGIQDHGHDHH